MTLSERFEAILEYSQLSIPKLADKLGFKTSQGIREILKGTTKTLSDAARIKILMTYPEINETWLTTGKGNMLDNIPLRQSNTGGNNQQGRAGRDLVQEQQLCFDLEPILKSLNRTIDVIEGQRSLTEQSLAVLKSQQEITNRAVAIIAANDERFERIIAMLERNQTQL